MSVAEAEAAVKLAENQAKRARQHLVAIRLLTRNGENTSNYTREQMKKNMMNMFNSNKAAKRARRSLRNAKLRAHLQSNDPTPILMLNDPPWYNLVEEELVPSPSRAKSQRKTRRRRRQR
jgi:hypothetical protein